MPPARAATLTTALFLIAAVLLSGVLPLWLDEILQLIDTRRESAAEMLLELPHHHAGVAPLGYLVQHQSLKATGFSIRRARLPAAIFGAAAVFTVALLGAEVGLSLGWLGAAVFAAFPLTLRYASEGRMYSQAVFFSVLGTLLYVRLSKQADWRTASFYTLALVAAVYTQPYSLFVGIAHVVWSLIQRERKTALLGSAAVALSVAAFLPWHLWSKAAAAADLPAGPAPHFAASFKTPLMVFREIAGAGYWGTGLLVILCVLAFRRRRLSPRFRSLLILLVVAPLVAALAADAAFDYFIAARQFLWILPAIAILVAAELERSTRAARVVAALLLAVCIWRNFRFYTKPSEDWRQAAGTLAAEVRRGACLVVAPQPQSGLYEMFQPELRWPRCDAPRVVLAITPYTTQGERTSAEAALAADGYKRVRQEVVGRSIIVHFRNSREWGFPNLPGRNATRITSFPRKAGGT